MSLELRFESEGTREKMCRVSYQLSASNSAECTLNRPWGPLRKLHVQEASWWHLNWFGRINGSADPARLPTDFSFGWVAARWVPYAGVCDLALS
jgi:hypothetical protein